MIFAFIWTVFLAIQSSNDGPHILTAVARDAAGNVGVSEPVNVVVDNTPPVVMLSGVADGDNVSGKVNLTAMAADVTTRVVMLSLTIAGTVVQVRNDGQTIVYNWNTSPYKKQSPVTIVATATDAAGNSIAKQIKVFVK